MSNNSNENSSASSSQPASSITDNLSQFQPNITNSTTPLVTSNSPAQPNINNSNNPSKNRSSLVPTHISRSKQNNCCSTYSPSVTENNAYNDASSDSSDSSKSIISVHNIFSKMKARHTSKQFRQQTHQPSQSHQPSQFRQPSQSYQSLQSCHISQSHQPSPSRQQSPANERNRSESPQFDYNESIERPYKIHHGDIEQIYSQNRYLYHLTKEINKDVKEIKAEVNRQRKGKESDISSQDVFTNVVKQLITQYVYPSQSTLKETLKSYLEEAYTEFMPDMRPNEFTNRSILNGVVLNASAPEIVNWKKSNQIAACFRSLFEQTESGVYWIDMIARSAFSTAAVPTMTSEHCAFMLAVCDIILNPKSKHVKCTEKLMKRRLKRYLNDLNGEEPSYESAQAVMNDEAGNRSRPTSETNEPEPASQSSSLMNYSQNEINNLFGIDY
ncbi:hypothetical protein C2G38_2195258 [Gigaspora rosea]|uniref:Uncharacterized protein n=1 Tax=Gigaspora rosea TaxID=44941 RepID=A0A397UYZ3_9GLOM|nr:hypothetical protein C2G38_2195258 [Gigaspora rosea]